MDKIDHVFLSVDQILYGLLFIKETIYLNYDFKICRNLCLYGKFLINDNEIKCHNKRSDRQAYRGNEMTG